MKNDATVKSLKCLVKSILIYKFITRLKKYLCFLDIKMAFYYCIKNKKIFLSLMILLLLILPAFVELLPFCLLKMPGPFPFRRPEKPESFNFRELLRESRENENKKENKLIKTDFISYKYLNIKSKFVNYSFLPPISGIIKPFVLLIPILS